MIQTAELPTSKCSPCGCGDIGMCPYQGLAATLILSQSGGGDYAHPILVSIPSFESHRHAWAILRILSNCHTGSNQLNLSLKWSSDNFTIYEKVGHTFFCQVLWVYTKCSSLWSRAPSNLLDRLDAKRLWIKKRSPLSSQNPNLNCHHSVQMQYTTQSVCHNANGLSYFLRNHSYFYLCTCIFTKDKFILIIYWLCKCSLFLGFIMSKKPVLCNHMGNYILTFLLEDKIL